MRNDETFTVQIQAKKPTAVLFVATWAKPLCPQAASQLCAIEPVLREQVTLASFDIDACWGVPRQFRVRTIPTVIVCCRGSELARCAGLPASAQGYARMIARVIGLSAV